MKQQSGQVMLAFGDVHVPHQHPAAVEVFCRAAEHLKPDLIVCLGDLVDCHQFSSFTPTWRDGEPESQYEGDLAATNGLLTRLQTTCKRLVMVEGNHEYRLDRWAASTAEGRGAYSMLAPRLNLSKDRQQFTYIRYGSADGRYPHYKINRRIVAVHGWSYARHATKAHLAMSQGQSVIHGHTHRVDTSMVQDVWQRGGIVQARGAGCLCKPIPLYGTGRPVEWVNAFILGYLGRRSDTLFTIPIMDHRCILPGGMEISA